MYKYFSDKVSRGFVSIYSARLILRITPSLLGLFLPIFLYELFDFCFAYVVYFYLTGHLLYALLIPLGGQYLNRIGLRRSLRVSLVFGALFYLVFYFLERGLQGGSLTGLNIIWLLAGSILALTFHRIMYWLPLHTDMAKFTSKSDRGRQVSLVSATVLVLGAVMPIVAGWILTVHSYDVLFLIAIVVYFTALLPLIFLPRTEEHFSWGYFETWRQFFSQGKRRLVLAYTGNGAEEAVNVIIWPIFIWELLEGNYFEVGAISSLVVAVSVVLQLSVGRFIDTKDKQKIMRWGNLFYAAGWIAKVFIATAFQIFVVSTYHNFAKIFARAPFDALMYEKAADQGHYVDEFTVLHEIAFQFGKSLMLIFALAVVPFLGITWTFVLAALASLAMNFLADQKAIQEGRHIG